MSKYPGNIITTGADTGYSVAFDGTGDYLTVADNAAFELGSGSFTIEGWVYLNSLPSSGSRYALVGKWAGLAISWIAQVYNNSGTMQLSFSYSTNGTGATSVDANAAVTAGAWHHIAYARNGTSFKMFLNGVEVTSSSTISATFFDGAAAVDIGRHGDGLNYFNGYISSLRIVKGTALYTANFTPPTQLLNVTNTSLLTCNSPAIVDQSSNNFTITANGDAKVSTFTPFAGYQAYNPALGAATPGIWSLSDALNAAATRQWNMYDPYFNYTTLKLSGNAQTPTPLWLTDSSTYSFALTAGGAAKAAAQTPFSITTYPASGSGFFNGSTDFLTAADNTALELGAGDFTIEGYVYLNSLPTSTNVMTMVGKWTNPNYSYICNVYNNAGTMQMSFSYTTNGTTSITISANATITTGVWYHLAYVRIGSSFKMFLNGTEVTSSATISGTLFDGTALLNIARHGDGTIGYLNGNISNLRIVKGVGVYTGNFTTPTAPLAATQSAGTNISAITGTQTSLLTLQASQASANSSFYDSSSNNFAITRNGNTTQGTFTPFSQTGWSNYFASGGRLLFSVNSAFDITQGNFTLEAWVNISSYSVSQHIAWYRYDPTPSGWAFRINQTTGYLQFFYTGGSTVTSTVAVPLNTWAHVAACRSGSTCYLFINGIQVGSAAFSNGTTQTTLGFRIGADSAGADNITGYVSNLRLVKNGALYTQPFTPSITPLTATVSSGTVSVLTCQTNRFVDNGPNQFSITPEGTTTAVQAFSPFLTNVAYTPALQGGSAYFDGSGDYLNTLTGQTPLLLGASDFTIEAWVYRVSNTSTAIIFNGQSDLASAGGSSYGLLVGTTNSDVYTNNGGFGVTSPNPTVGQWAHIALARTGGTLSSYLNGTRVGTNSSLGASIINNGATTYPPTVGMAANGLYPFTGYISGLRLIKGSGGYNATNATITIPTAPPTAVTNTSILLNFANAGITDSTGKNVLETIGNAQVSTVQSKFGGSSMYFDGTIDCLFEPSSANYGYGTGDFTIEFWLRLNVTTIQTIVSNLSTSSGTAPHIYYDGAGSLKYYTAAAARINGGALNANQWYHIAVCRASGTTRMFIDGAQTGSSYADTNNYGVSNPLGVGDYLNGTTMNGTSTLNGYMGDLRITKYARYTGNFTPPTSLLQNQ